MKKIAIESTSLFKQGIIQKDFPLKELTSFKLGGNAQFFFEPSSKAELIEALHLFIEEGISLSLIGGGTNLLISDKGISGAVLSLKKLNSIEIIDATKLQKQNTKNDENADAVFVKVGAGLLITDFTQWAIDNSISGLENFGGLPGSVGGASFMNARCYGSSISDIIYSAQTLSIKNNKVESSEYLFDKADWAYKKSPFQKNTDGIKIMPEREIVLSVVFKLAKGIQAEIKTQTEECYNDRIQKGHFKAPSAGSTFKNNRDFGKPSGKIIEEVGLKGLSNGGAQVAPWHGNFIINKDNASSKEIFDLISIVQKKVFEETKFLLEPEVIFCGDDF